ncbi:MAG: hypothetical protein HQ481_07455 [Alphaproteobacteria bacterium]|nr:hypothetical protein [Alphaproteobacteria bacterium]
MPRSPTVSAVAAVLATSMLAGCLAAPPPAAEGIGFREARFHEIEAMRDWRACRDDGATLDQQARAAGEPGRYLAAARALEGCEANLGAEASGIAVEERMRAYGLAIQARLKGGDLAGARDGLDRFRGAFPGRDLYFDDGTSFLHTMDTLLAAGGEHPRRPSRVANVSATLGEEIARLIRWSRR